MPAGSASSEPRACEGGSREDHSFAIVEDQDTTRIATECRYGRSCLVLSCRADSASHCSSLLVNGAPRFAQPPTTPHLTMCASSDSFALSWSRDSTRSEERRVGKE